jgi:hypothetical protein
MQVTLQTLLQAKASLEKLIQLNFKVKISYALLKFIKKANEELKDFEEAKDKLVKRYGTEKDGNIIIENNSPNMEPFIKELNELLAHSVEMPDLKIKIAEIEAEAISTSDLLQLEFILEE